MVTADKVLISQHWPSWGWLQIMFLPCNSYFRVTEGEVHFDLMLSYEIHTENNVILILPQYVETLCQFLVPNSQWQLYLLSNIMCHIPNPIYLANIRLQILYKTIYKASVWIWNYRRSQKYLLQYQLDHSLLYCLLLLSMYSETTPFSAGPLLEYQHYLCHVALM